LYQDTNLHPSYYLSTIDYGYWLQKIQPVLLRRITLILVCYFVVFNQIFAQERFLCDGSSFISVIESGKTTFYALNLSDTGLTQTPISSEIEASINAIGFNPIDSLIYGIDTETNRLYRIWADGTIEDLQYIPLQGDYFAGDIHPNGEELILLNKDSIALVHLNKMETPVEYIPIVTTDQSGIFTTDIAYHPITNELFGYDGLQGKLIKIDDNTGEVDNVSFPSVNFNDGIPALFFDSRAELYGIGNNNATQESTLFKFDINTGEVDRFSFDGAIGDRDGCSCPYTVKLFQKVNNPFLAPCSEMELVLTISNLTGSTLAGYELFEDFPTGFIIEEIVSNPFIGDVESGIGEDQLKISNLDIPIGVDSIKLIISIPEDAAGNSHNIQAQLSSLNSSTNLVDSFTSQDLLNPNKNSPTKIQIESGEEIFTGIIPELIELCENDTFILDLPCSNDFEYVWSDGYDSLNRIFTLTEDVSLDVISRCETFTYDISARETQFSISLGEDIHIEQGEKIVLDFESNSLSPVDSLVWKTIDGDIPCQNCQNIQIMASNDIKYILVATNKSGCITSDGINIIVTRNIYAPNVFSPNSDGFNDFFYLLSSQPGIEINNFTIYNRWGSIVFNAKNLKTNIEVNGWDGKVNEKKANAGTYFWTANIAFNESRIELLKGSFILTR